MPEETLIRKNLIKSYCVISFDSSALLNYVFGEVFKIKVASLIEDIKETSISCEILPQVSHEISKKLLFAAEQYVRILGKCKLLISRLLGCPLNQVKIKRDIAVKIEKAFGGIIEEIERKHYPQVWEKIRDINSARIIETTVMLEFKRFLSKSKERPSSLEEFFKELEDEFQRKYSEFNDSLNSLYITINAQKLKKDEIPKATEKLREILAKKCNIHRSPDLELISEAVCRMYSINKWYALASTDYADLVNNKEAVDNFTLLTISDPLYVLFHLDEKIDIALNPIGGAMRKGVPYQAFIETHIPSGVV
ncbi:MAG: hypothetical protein QW660_03470 [Candidatus Bathyarchaeia archaeon]